MSIRFASCLFIVIFAFHNCSKTYLNTIPGEPVIYHDMARLWDADISPDNRLLALAGDPGVKVIQIEDGSVIAEWNPFKKAVQTVAFSLDGRTLAAGGWDGSVRVWDMETGKELFAKMGISSEIQKVVFSRNGERLAIKGRYWIEVWNVHNWKQIKTFNFRFLGDAFDFHPEGNRFYIAGWQHKGELWEIEPKRMIGSIGDESSAILSCIFSKDGKRLVIGEDSPIQKCSIWDTDTLSPLTEDITLFQTPRILEVSPNNKMFFAAGDCCFLSVFDLETGKMIKKKIDNSAWWLITAKYSPDGQYILTGRADRKECNMYIWDVKSEKLIKTVKQKTQ